MEDKDYIIQKEGTMNTFSEKQDYVQEKEAYESTHTDNSISGKNTDSHRYNQG